MINDIVAQSENIQRPENQITKTEKENLWSVLQEDETVLGAIDEIETIIDENLNPIVKSLEVYESY